MKPEGTCFIHKKICLLKCEDRGFMVCPSGGVWWTCEQVDELLDKATRLPSRLCQNKRPKAGMWPGYLVSKSNAYFHYPSLVFSILTCVSVRQTQFFLSGSHGDGQWIVPLTLCCGSYEARKSFLMQEKSEALDVKDLLGSSSSKGNPWIKVNVDQTGFFRVKYDDELSARLRYAIESKCLSTNDKYGNNYCIFVKSNI